MFIFLKRMFVLFFLSFECFIGGNLLSESNTQLVRAVHPDVANVSIFAQDPEIVTPVGIAVAPDGRVFVQENHTHKRGKNYIGPSKDRILIFEDTDGDGVSDKRSVFYEGLVFSTDLLFGPDGHLYVANRWFVGRFRNAHSQFRATSEPEILVECKTDGDYPHNGVGGLAIDPADPEVLVFGFGENLGQDYTFVGSDGIQISGGGEGGSTYQCRTDGSNLKRLSTGHWNAFGMTFDLFGNLFSTDNDPNSTPPNRLLHVISGADFGYEYRYGRSGSHPLVDWHGKKPGKLGMIGSLGEAACGVVPYGENSLLSASWTDNRIDLHNLVKTGESFSASREPLIVGPDNFRPVHFSFADQGKSLFVTDWVNLSYPVHGAGKIWKVTFKKEVDLKPLPRPPTKKISEKKALALLGHSDPYARTKAIEILRGKEQVLKRFNWKKKPNPVLRAHWAVAMKKAKPKSATWIIPDLLTDSSPDVRYVGIKWIADEGMIQYLPHLKKILDRNDLSRGELLATIAAIAEVSGGLKSEFSASRTLLEIVHDESKHTRLRALALRNIPLDFPRLTVKTLEGLAATKDYSLLREATRSLAAHPNPSKEFPLARIASNTDVSLELRADAIAGLAAFANSQSKLLQELRESKKTILSLEASRALASAGIIDREVEEKPKPNDILAWENMLDSLSGEPNLKLGRRLFFHPLLAACYNCHAVDGRGIEVGPNLTHIDNHSQNGRAWLLQHILNPSSEVAPYYRPQVITTSDGKSQVGFILGREGNSQSYVGVDGKTFSARKSEVIKREELSMSIMPAGLLTSLTNREIRDLLAYLMKEKTEG
tara:strand:- start:1349 stop:3823 length:2475 start_codon:yes stop_codon:yes gene_type:complete